MYAFGIVKCIKSSHYFGVIMSDLFVLIFFNSFDPLFCICLYVSSWCTISEISLLITQILHK